MAAGRAIAAKRAMAISGAAAIQQQYQTSASDRASAGQTTLRAWIMRRMGRVCILRKLLRRRAVNRQMHGLPSIASDDAQPALRCTSRAL